jgi:iron complex outermembrane receptor protein
MRKFTNRLSTGIAMGALLIAAGTPAFAQSEDAGGDEDEIIVTGTLIKGIAPVGTQVIGIDSGQVVELGVTNATDLLRKIPQIGDFNAIPQPTTDASIPFSPISLRGIDALSGQATLILLNGKRIVPTSPGQNWIDTQMIPAGAIERVEVIADGGSSIYGSDAVAGVINFVTKRKADGIELRGSYGLGHGSYQFWDVGATAGHEWNTGSAVLTYSYSDRTSLFGRSLDYLIEDKRALGGQDNRSTSCPQGTISANDTTYALPGRQPGSVNYCSSFDSLAYYPDERRHSLYGTFTQELFDGAKLEVDAFWSRRNADITDPANARSSGTITTTNPFFSSVAGETSQSVAISFENIFGIRSNPSTYEAWQVSPTLTFNFAPKWTASFGFNYGESDSVFITNQINGTALQAAFAGTTTQTALNPYNVSATNASVLAGIADSVRSDSSHQEILEARLALNGSLFALPAGDVKVAFGTELRREVYNILNTQGTLAAPAITASRKSDRDVVSVFGELYVPVLDTLQLSLSARHDRYSDVGSTTNPKLGFTFKPVDWVSFRGSWGKSFHAPSLADLSAPLGYQLFLPISPFRAATSPFFPDFFKPSFLLVGAAPDIKPERASTWSVGADVKPTEGLKLGVSYWGINYKDRIDQNAGFFFGPGYYTDPVNAPYFIVNPATPQAVIAKFGTFPVLGFPDLQTMFNIFGSPYVVSDQRKQNLGALKLQGLDFNAGFETDLGGGKLDLGFNGTYILKRNKENVRGAGFADTLDLGDFNRPITRFNLTGNIGFGAGPFYASATAYHRGGAKVGTEDISSFTTVSLFGKYNITEKISATINVDNLFDTAPPLRPTVTNGRAYIDAGRVVRFGVNAKF